MSRPLADTLGTVDSMSERIIDLVPLIGPDYGLWYFEAHATALRIGPTLEIGAGVIAALSPRMPWARNVALAEEACRVGHASGALFDNVHKADAILAGADPLDVLGGAKVRSFYACILDPWNLEHVCVDRHAFDVTQGRETDDKARKILDRVGAYDYVADAYRYAADVLGDTPSAIQARAWVAWRTLKGLPE